MYFKRYFTVILFLLLSLFAFSVYAEGEIYINPGEIKSVKMEAGKATYLSFKPSVDGEYAFTSSSDCDTLCALYDENMKMLMSDDDGGDTSNFYINYSFEAGEKYIFSVWYYGESIDYNMPVSLKLLKAEDSHYHLYTEEFVSNSTCNTEGESRFYCVCGDFYFVKYDRLKHVYKTVSVTEPDCLNQGVKIEKCELCGEEIEQIIDVLGHEFTDELIVDIEPTCTTKGYASRHCIRCDETSQSTAIDKTEHITPLDYEIVKEPSCTAKGEKVKRCTYCNKLLETVPLDKTEHILSADYVTVKSATCTSEGEKVKRCVVCSKVLETVKIIKTEHIASDEYELVKQPTCTSVGEKIKKCKVCSKVLEKASVERISHSANADYEIIKEPTCTAAGEKVKRCSVCNKVVERVDTDKKGHTPESSFTVIKKSTCTAKGEKVKYCSVCKVITERAAIGSKGHNYASSYTVDSKASLTDSGKKSRHCKRCGAKTDAETISKIKTVMLSKNAFTYNEKTKALKITVKNSKGNKLKKDRDYTVTYKKKKSIGQHKVTVTFKGAYEGKKTLTYLILPGNATLLDVAQTENSVKLSWKKLKGNVKYRIYRKTNSGRFKFIIETSKTNAVIDNLKSGTEYTFSIKAVKKVKGKVYKSINPCRITVSTFPQKPSLAAYSDKSRNVTLSWNRISCDGYEIYKYNSSVGEYELFKTIKDADITSYERNNMKRGETCYFKIRSYKYNGNGCLYSDFSNTVSVNK